MSGRSNWKRSRRRELAKVSLSLIAILLVSATTARMLVAAWDDHGLVYHLGHGAATTLFGNIDGLVVFAVALVTTWLLLFALDGSKRVQGALLLLSMGLVFVPSLVLMGRWVGTVDFGSYPLAAGLGVGLALAVAAIDMHVPWLQGDGRREFPMVASGLYALTVVVMFVGFLERHLSYESPYVAVANPPAVTSTGGGLMTIATDAASALTLVFLVGYFVRYADVTTVAISSPNEEALANFIGDIYAEADLQYESTTALTGGYTLNRIQNTSSPVLEEPVSFEFNPGGAFGRRRVISTQNVVDFDARDVPTIEKRVSERSSSLSQLWHGFKRQVLLSVPDSLRRELGASESAKYEKVDAADTLLFLVPLSDIVRDEPHSEDPDDPTAYFYRPNYLSVYDDLNDAYRSDPTKRVRVVVTDAEVALDFHGSGTVTDSQFADFLRRGLDLHPRTQVVPVHADDGGRSGFYPLLREL